MNRINRFLSGARCRVAIVAVVAVSALGAASCSVVASTSNKQCSTDADCLFNNESKLSLPTCNASGICEVATCVTPTQPDPGAVELNVPALLIQVPPGGRLPGASDFAPLTDPAFKMHACARADAACARTTCGWLSPAVTGTYAGGPGVPAFFKVPVALPFDGYFVVDGDPNAPSTAGYGPSAIFGQDTFFPQTANVFNGAAVAIPLFLAADSTNNALAFAASSSLTPGSAVAHVYLLEGAFSNGVQSIGSSVDGAEVKLVTQAGADALATIPDLRRLYLDPAGNVKPGAASTVGSAVVFLNIPPGIYEIVATKGSVVVRGTLIAIRSTASTTTLILPASDGGT